MAQPGVFDELSSRINKGKRPDSGIHNSVELSADEIKTEEKREQRFRQEELNDSGQESADQMDSSVASTGKKKSGFLKSFKKIFKKKKGPSNPSSKSTKKKNEDVSIQEQYRPHSHSDIVSSVDSTTDAGLKRFNTDASGLSPKRPPKPSQNITNIESKDSEDEKASERKASLKDAQQYIRSSLRKLKGGAKKNDVTAESADIEEFEVDNDASLLSRNSSFGNASFDDEFFSKSLAGDDRLQLNSSNVTVKLGDITPTSPRIENAVAKDRIRVAPQNRRKPSRYRNAPPKPARTASSFSFKEDLSLSKIDEDKDNFTSVSRHSSNVSRHDSARESHPSYFRSDSESTHRSSIDSNTHGSQSNDHIPRALLNKHSFSSGDELQKPRSMAQRSFSTNSRENVNRPKPPVKPPRSAHASSSSLNGEENFVKKLSLTELRSQLFYTDEEKTKELEMQTGNETKSVFVANNTDEIRTSNERIFTDERLSFEEKRKSFGESSITVSRENKPNSLGDNRRSLLNRNSSECSDEGKKSSVTDLRQSLGNITNKRNSFGSNRNSSVSSDTKRDSYGASFGIGFSNSHTSLGAATEKKEEQRSSSSMENRDDISSSKEKTSTSDSNTSQELVFSKSEDPGYGLMAFALTSPRQDRVDPMVTSNMSRSKSLSGKLEKMETSPPRSTTNHSNINNSKSVGYINEVGSKPTPSPRKLRKSSPPEKLEESEAPAEFHRISLRKVPKMEDYMETEESKEEQEANTSSILDFVNNELVLDEPSSSPRQSSFGKFNASQSTDVSNKTSIGNREDEPKELKQDVSKPSFAFKRSSIHKVDLTSSETNLHDHASMGSPVKTTDIETREQSQLKRASWKSFEEKQTVSESPPENVEFKRNSLKKIDSSSIEEPKSFSLPVSRTTELNEERERDKPPRPLVKNRPTVHGTQKKDFSFQSNDIKNRSKSLGSADQKRLTEKAATASNAEEESDSTEPAWFKLARRKQKNAEVNDENVSQTSPRNSLQEPTSPPVKPKPKVNPRPIVSPKPEVSPRPPPVARKPQSNIGAPPIRTSRQFSAKADISKDHCLVCGKAAYSLERIDVGKHVIHKGCAKCIDCSRKLNIGGIFFQDGNVYCSNHK